MPFRPPLTADQLREIRERQPWNPDVLTLLWEIKRMRSLLLRLDQVSCDLHRPAGLMGDIYDELMQQIAAGPRCNRVFRPNQSCGL